MTLPTPLEMTALGGALLLGAAAVVFFLKIIQLGIYMALFGLFLLGCAYIANDYEKMGDAKAIVRLQPVVDAANAAQHAAEAARDHAQADTASCVAMTQVQNDEITKWQAKANANIAASKAEAARSAQIAASSQAQIKSWQATAAAKEAAGQTCEQKLADIDRLLRDAAKARAAAKAAMPVPPGSK